MFFSKTMLYFQILFLIVFITVASYIGVVNHNSEKALTVEYGENITIEQHKNINSSLISDSRYLITTSTKEKLVDKVYLVVTTNHGKDIKTKKEISIEELAILLRK